MQLVELRGQAHTRPALGNLAALDAEEFDADSGYPDRPPGRRNCRCCLSRDQRDRHDGFIRGDRICFQARVGIRGSQRG